MAFNGDEGSIIDLQVGIEMTSQFREDYPGVNKGVFFGKNLLNQLLDQDGAMGIRFYFGVNDSQALSLVLVAADAEEKDMTALVGDHGKECPNCCDQTSPLCE
ncbi:hypothetical protein GCM10027048_28490 [Hymenobacter coalescens]